MAPMISHTKRRTDPMRIWPSAGTSYLKYRRITQMIPRLWLEPMAPHDAREGDAGSDYYSSDGTGQYPNDDHVRDDVSGAVCFRPQVIGDPAAQLQVRGQSDEYAPGPPVTQPAEALSLPGTPADTGFRSGREGVGWHAQRATISCRAASIPGAYRLVLRVVGVDPGTGRQGVGAGE